MRIFCFLLVCAILGLQAGAYEKRRDDEIAKLPIGLGVYDDNGNLVNITTQENSSRDYKGQISFTLYTKKNSINGQDLRINDTSSLTSSNFDAKKPTYFITHGWMNTGNSDSCTLIRDAYLSTADIDPNVIVVDWSKYSLTINYIDASYRVQVAGKKVGQMIGFLNRNGLNFNNVTLIGHSLGAHVMGIAGYTVKCNVQRKVKHIVGLDPALPMFNFAEVGDALTKEDAQHVQIIHTNAGGLGYICPRGDSDFFPNGGVRQAGCCNGDLFTCAACSHGRAYEFFAESITKTFEATRCDSYVWFESNYCGARRHTAPMGGLDLDIEIPGTYYLRTSSEKPFSKAEDRSVSQADFAPFLTNTLCEVIAK